MANQLWTSRFGIAVILFGLVCVVLPNSNCLRDLQNTAQLRLSKATRMEKYSYLGHSYKSHIHQGLQCSN